MPQISEVVKTVSSSPFVQGKESSFNVAINDLKSSKDCETRLKAIDSLGNLAKQGKQISRVVDALIDTLGDKTIEPIVASLLVEIGENHPKIVVNKLSEALEDSNSEIDSIETMASVLGKIGPDARKSVSALIEAYDDARDSSTEATIIEAIVEIDEGGISRLVRRLGDAQRIETLANYLESLGYRYAHLGLTPDDDDLIENRFNNYDGWFPPVD